uniref:Calcineurin-like phosphoesterase domain-containing protein n=1 Tax=viral metagenome TaxID=1070528 RepID=A0A6C0EPZ5_9ZZZZ
MKTFVIGDIHGRYEALKECLLKAKFNFLNDKLIVLGDIVDGGYNTDKVIELLLKIPNLKFVLGNHDLWVIEHIKNGWSEDIWLGQGGANTLKCYGGRVVKEGGMYKDDVILDGSKINIPVTHQELFNRGVFYHIENDMLFVHGGFNIDKGIENTDKHELVWDRDIIKYAQKNKIPGYNKVFIGHTTTQMINNKTDPIKLNNLWMLDCGAGWNGKLCIMDINTEEYWLSKRQKKP